MKEVSTIFWENGSCDILEEITDVHLISVNLQKKILKNPVFKSTIYFLDVYQYMIYTNFDD